MSGTKGVINVSGCSFDGMLNSRAIADGAYTDSLLTIVDKNLGEAVKKHQASILNAPMLTSRSTARTLTVKP